ncbi:MAG: 3-dehydroquinate synthase [Actinobacteria bacterium]|nr:3-dehydroquinate synthase [Actinomycetota bacterium]
MSIVRVELGERSYQVLVGRDLLAGLDELAILPASARRAAIVTQEPSAEHHLEPVLGSLVRAGLEVRTHQVPDGEGAKTPDICVGLWLALAEWPLGRDDVIVALGGGVVGDLAGFIAATWHRGIALVHLPTTLLAQVDAAIGGKAAINLALGKNLVGAFHQPIAVVADVSTLQTLAPRTLIEGLGEVVKYGLIRDPSILDTCEQQADAVTAGEPHVLQDLVERSAAVKAAVVAADERESGERAHLNLGHTYGHALEAVTEYHGLLHGEAVSIGTVLALRLGVRLGITPPEIAQRGEALLERLGLPVRAPALDRADIWAAMLRDKKADEDVRFVLLADVAQPVLVTPPVDAVDAVLDEVEMTL